MNLCSSMLIEETHSKEVRQKAKIARLLHQTDDDQRSGMVYRRILVALRGEKADEAVLSHVQALAAQMRARITLLWVIVIADDGDNGLGRQWQLEVGSSGWRRKNQVEAYLAQLESRFKRAGLSVQTALVIGTRSEADEIVSYAVEHGCDLIAMASDSRPWYVRWLSGNQAGAVQRKATLPTLFVSDDRRELPIKRTAPKANRLMALLGEPEL